MSVCCLFGCHILNTQFMNMFPRKRYSPARGEITSSLCSPPWRTALTHSYWLPGRRSQEEHGLVEWNRSVTSWELQQALRQKEKEKKAVNQTVTQCWLLPLIPPLNARLSKENSRGNEKTAEKQECFGNKMRICLGDGIMEVDRDISELCFIVFHSSKIYYIANLNCKIVYIAKIF